MVSEEQNESKKTFNPTFTPLKNFYFLLYKFVTLDIAKETIRPYLILP